MNRIKTPWLIVIAVCALPIILPLLIAVAGVVLALVVSVLGIVFSVMVSGAALVLAGIVSLVAAPVVMMQDFGFGLLVGGQALLGLGVGILLLLGMSKLARGLARTARQAIGRRRVCASTAGSTDGFYQAESQPIHEGGLANG